MKSQTLSYLWFDKHTKKLFPEQAERVERFQIPHIQFPISPISRTSEAGQALVTLLFFVVLAITIISAAVAIVLANALSASLMQEGINAYSIAESGAENALLRLDRNLNYTGETMTVYGGTATITATGTNPVTILSIGTANSAIKKIQVVVNINNGQLSIVSWKEVY